ncbi:DUF4397 domain-containing protein [Mucilaginibacter sp. PAMB04168]|uniref:DUF4397 domain-containing protein n=1 Tax=Mucilaginibacter sp. PAMB04168 TaxID=3138567 RepID=UPI0031F68093
MFKSKNIFYSVFALNLLVLVLPLLSSCGKSDTVNPTGLNVQLQVVNLSPNSFPIELNINNQRVNSYYRYNATPSYFYLTNTTQPLQIRSTRVGDTVSIFSRDTIQYQPNTRYSLFFMGLYGDPEYKLRSLVTADDTEPLPEIGKGGKVRFINGSPRSGTGFDIWANGAPVIKNAAFGKVSNYVVLPPGNYTFRAYATNTSNNSLGEIANITIQDGRLYTLYSRGIIGRALTDTAAFGMALVPNNPTIIR